MTKNERFGLGFTNTGFINSGTGVLFNIVHVQTILKEAIRLREFQDALAAARQPSVELMTTVPSVPPGVVDQGTMFRSPAAYRSLATDKAAAAPAASRSAFEPLFLEDTVERTPVPAVGSPAVSKLAAAAAAPTDAAAAKAVAAPAAVAAAAAAPAAAAPKAAAAAAAPKAAAAAAAPTAAAPAANFLEDTPEVKAAKASFHLAFERALAVARAPPTTTPAPLSALTLGGYAPSAGLSLRYPAFLG
jgi:hypothetical protein